MLTPSLALLISIVIILILIRVKVPVGFAVFGGSLILSLLVLPGIETPNLMLKAITDYQTIKLLTVIACALTMSSLMESKGMLAQLAHALESLNPKLALHIVPAVIGFIPMTAGSVVSAIASHDLVKKVGINPEQSTFINYWFRHIWEYSIPTFAAIITASALLAVPLSKITATMFPATLLAIGTGAIVSYSILKKFPTSYGNPSKNMAIIFIRAAWPIVLLVILILAGVDAIIAFPVVLALLLIQQRPSRKDLVKALKYGLDPKTLFLLYSVMLYKTTMESANAAQAVLSDMQSVGLPVVVIVAFLPFLIGMITGISVAVVGITFPLLMPFLVSDGGLNSIAVLLAYGMGIIGMMLSPVHLCLILSAEYFKANLLKVYNYLLPPSAIVVAVLVLIFSISFYVLT
jgi:integral membrane protein (TIGR00529 family)